MKPARDSAPTQPNMKPRRGKAKGARRLEWSGTLPVVHPRAAGSDLWVAIPPEAGRPATEMVRAFSPTTAGLRAVADWLSKEAITHTALEATGIYWLPLYHLLSERGFHVIVVNPRDTKALKKKSDIADCQWLQYLLSVGLLKASFVPPAAILAMRGVWRHRDSRPLCCLRLSRTAPPRWVRQAGMHVQHMQKALDEMNVNLHFVIDDLTGKTGLSIVDAILSGQRDDAELAKLRDYRCKATPEQIAAALEGQWLTHCLFVLGQARAASVTVRPLRTGATALFLNSRS